MFCWPFASLSPPARAVLVRVLLLTCACLGNGCAGSSSQGSPVSVQDAGFDSAVPSTDAGSGCVPGDTLPCVCADAGVGTRACVEGSFEGSACTDCKAVDTDTGTFCVAGRYTGNFAIPKYLPAAAGCLWSIWGGSGTADFGFSLGAAAAAAEFVEVIPTESCFEFVATGSVDGGLEPPGGSDAAVPGQDAGAGGPTSMGLEGTLDCATGKLEGILKGTYYAPISVCGGFLGVPEQEYYSIKGRFTGTYNPKTQTFEDGVLELQEPKTEAQMVLPIGDPFGGKGTWEAQLTPDAPAPEPKDQCYDVAHYQDFELAP